MTIKELAALLADLPPDAPVFLHSYEGGYRDVIELTPQLMRLNVNENLDFGPHFAAHEEGAEVVSGFIIE